MFIAAAEEPWNLPNLIFAGSKSLGESVQGKWGFLKNFFLPLGRFFKNGKETSSAVFV